MSGVNNYRYSSWKEPSREQLIKSFQEHGGFGTTVTQSNNTHTSSQQPELGTSDSKWSSAPSDNKKGKQNAKKEVDESKHDYMPTYGAFHHYMDTSSSSSKLRRTPTGDSGYQNIINFERNDQSQPFGTNQSKWGNSSDYPTIKQDEPAPDMLNVNISVFDFENTASKPSTCGVTSSDQSQPNTVIKEEYNYSDMMIDDTSVPTTNAALAQQHPQHQIRDESIYSTNFTFEELHLKEELLKGIYGVMRFSKPSKIQGEALPVILQDPPQNVICQSESGNGKTIAFILAMLQRVNANLKATQALCISPTRELARQLADVTIKMGTYTGITVGLVVKEARITQRHMDEQIIIGTPGSLLQALKRRVVRTHHLAALVLDEADSLLEQDGLGDQSIRIKQLMENRNFQIMMFSATYSARIIKYCKEFAPNAREMLLKDERVASQNVQQVFMDCDNLECKYEVLCNIYNILNVSQSIIFCKLRSTAAKISSRMESEGHRVKYLHAGLTPNERDVVIDDFRRGEFKVLISTNVVSRGIDISQISLVINYDLPLNVEGEPDMDTYVHRLGRTGRFGREGKCINFIHDQKTYEYVQYIESKLNTKMARVPTEDWEVAEIMLKKYVY